MDLPSSNPRNASSVREGGPLKGVRVIELAGLGPAPFACMLLADMGADVVLVDRPEPAELGVATDPRRRISNRGRRSVAVDLKSPAGVAVVRRLIADADVLVEGFRPGVAERLGLGPDDCRTINPRLVYARMTGWGQQGPLAQSAAHDLNYIAITGALHALGAAGQKPQPPLNYVGDFGGGSMYLALGILAAVIEARQSGRGQVVDAAIVDGAASLSTFIFTQMANGQWSDARGTNLADGGRPWYDVYETRDGRYVTLAAIEGRFYRKFLELTGLDGDPDLPDQHDPAGWPELRRRFAQLFLSRTRDEWDAILGGTDCCYAPVLTAAEALTHPHNLARGTFVERDGLAQPAPAPRFDRTPSAIGCPPPVPGADTHAVLLAYGFAEDEIAALNAAGTIR